MLVGRDVKQSAVFAKPIISLARPFQNRDQLSRLNRISKQSLVAGPTEFFYDEFALHRLENNLYIFLLFYIMMYLA